MQTGPDSPAHGTARTVLLTDPEQRAALAAARALGASGYRVHTIGETAGLAGRSRAVTRAHTVPRSVLTERNRYLAAVAALVQREHVQVVLPITDRASRLLLGQEAVLGCAVAGPEADAYARASDKQLLLRVAADCGIRVPQQVTLKAPGEALPDQLDERFPLVVKPARSVIEAAGQTISTSVRHVPNAAALREVLATIPAEAYPLMLQERIVGEGVGVFLLRTHGRTLLNFGHRRLREKPPAGGVSTYREAVEPAPSLLNACETLLDRLDFSGVAMVEFKMDDTTGEPVLMEINARLWGSLQLALDAGLDFPGAMVALALGEPVPPSLPSRTRVRSVWELGELDHALALARRSAADLHAPPGLRVGVGAALRALADHTWDDRPEVFRWSDPKPFLAELGRWLRRR